MAIRKQTILLRASRRLLLKARAADPAWANRRVEDLLVGKVDRKAVGSRVALAGKGGRKKEEA